MIVQHPMLWCAVFLMAGIAVGLNFPLPYYLPMLVAGVIACTLTRKTRYWHDVLTLLVWLLLGCSRASIVSINETKPAWQQTVEQKARQVQSSLIARLEMSGVSPHTLALCSALAVGERSGMERETRQAYNRIGAGHLLALSGMHLGILYSFMYLIFIRWVRHSKWRWHALPLMLLCLWGYALVAGMPVSLVRAALMLSVLTVLSLMQYRTDPLHPLALSAIIILLISPTDLYSISFQLSFAAVFFLLALWEPLTDLLPETNWAIKILITSCIASFGTMPLVTYYFHQLPLLSPLLSLILIPLTTIIIYLTLAAMLLPVAPLGWLLNATVLLQQKIIDFAGSIPFATLTDIYPSTLMVALMYGATVIAVVRLRTRGL